MPKENQKVVIVDYELGNLFSVKHACSHIGLEAIISSDKKDLENAKAVILPGVGAFGDAMQNLERLDLISPLKSFIASGKPFLGICLGMQLLFEESEEFGAKNGFGIVRGIIKKIPYTYGGQKMRVPQIAWNHIKKPDYSIWEMTPLAGIKDAAFMYFVHSYYAQPADKKDILTLTDYNGFEYCSAIRKNNIFATQFHPEKSGRIGLKIYENWKLQLT